MKLDDNMIQLISDLEYIIGNSCYNPNSYDREDDLFRYPVCYGDEGIETKIWSRLPVEDEIGEVDIDLIMTAKYKFGSNRLQVSKAIVKVLEELEQRYGIDIYKLEKKYLKENK